MDKIDDVAHMITEKLIVAVREAWKASVPTKRLTTKEFHKAVQRGIKLYKHLESEGEMIPDWPEK